MRSRTAAAPPPPEVLRHRRPASQRTTGDAGCACGCLSPGDLSPDLDRLEPGIAPVDYKDAKALLHARLDVVGVRRVAAWNVELLARREHLLNRRLPALRVERALAARVRGGEHAAQR